MAAVRRNIVSDAASRADYARGVGLLKAEQTGVTTTQAGVPGPARQLSTYDLFVLWHHRSMNTMTPPNQGDRNAAHRGPVFLPWHRFMLIFFEAQLQRVLNKPTFGLPYWDWAADGELPPAQQGAAPLWKADGIGGQGTPVTTGPFTQAKGFAVTIASDANGTLRSLAQPRGLRRVFDPQTGLPRKADVQGAVGVGGYDGPGWSASSPGFRNRLEGWIPAATSPHLHNRVHVFVGGDMSPASSPNDPVFFLNHCNVDRIWSAWLAKNPPPSPTYAPPANAPQSLFRHRLDDPLYSIFTAQNDTRWTPRRMLDVSVTYGYDSLAVA
jgi:tyrosinase